MAYTQSLGWFEDRSSGRRFEVLKVFHDAQHSPMDGRRAREPSNYEYVTACGLDANDSSGNETVFELIQTDGTLHRVAD